MYINKQLCICVIIMITIYYITINNKGGCKSIEQFQFLSKPHIKDKDKIFIKTKDDKYVTSCANCIPKDMNIQNRCKKILCLKNRPYRASQFVYHNNHDGTFSLETYDGMFLKRCTKCIEACPHAICADGVNSKLQTHKFVLIKNPDKTIAIKADNGRMLNITDCRQNCGSIITAQGLNRTNNFVIKMISKKTATIPKRIFSKKTPKQFPSQWPYSQH